MSDISNRILSYLETSGYSYSDLSAITDIPKSALQRYCTGVTEKIPLDRLTRIAEAFKVPVTYLLGWDTPSLPDNIIPMPEMRKIPLIGSIACGKPILAEEHIEDYIDIPKHIKADFALTCKGDSMINARIHPGDVVYIRRQDQVETGEIAAVMIDDEATLKRFYHYPEKNMLILKAENPKYEDFIFIGSEIQNLRILGKAVAFTSKIS